MALDLLSAVDPVELTGYVRAALADLEQNRFILGGVLPTTTIDDIEYRFYSGGAGLVDAATFRAFDAETPIGARRGAVRVSGELPPVGRKVRMGEYDRLRLRNVSDEVLRQSVLNDAASMAQAVAARLELARSEALFDGSLTLNENGVVATIDYGRTSSHDATAATVWSTAASATPITDLLAARELIRDAGGEPDFLAMNSQTYGEMIATAQVKNLATGVVTPSIVTDASVSQILAAHGLPPVTIYSARVGVAGTSTKVLGDGKVLLADRSQLGATLSGTTAEQQEWAGDVQGMEPGIFALAWKEQDPVAVWTKATALAVPVLATPDLSVGLSV
jgi:hypothetical protein